MTDESILECAPPKNIYENETASRQEIVDLKPREGSTKVSIGTICDAGTTRSKFLAQELEDLGYEATNRGVRGVNPVDDAYIQDVLDGKYQALVFATPGIAENFKTTWESSALSRGKEIPIPTRTIDLPEGSGMRYYRNPTNPYNSEADFLHDQQYVRSEFDRLGFIPRK